LFNHESPLRPERFVTQKVVRSACRIAEGKQNKLPLGNIEIQRDWAPEYVEAIYLMLQQESPDDFVIATGQTRKLQDFVAAAFEAVGLDWREHTTIDETLFRPTEIMIGKSGASKAGEKLGWRPKYKMAEIVWMMVQAATEAGV
jgi:GDPmannose 4,6-dehydratase